ncbi:MAG TPA: hypothetical protein VLD61_08485, partial [Methylomirabilota bacterium]|nr:hypothetical protein [Methylomirabilota bacterium]
MTRERHRHWRRAATVTVRIACLFAALGTIVGYHVVGAKYYRSYWVPQGVGMISLLPDELAHFALYGAFSLVAVALLVVAFDPWQSGGRVAIQPEGAALRGSGLAVMVTAVAVAATTFLISRHVLQHTVISDDEHVYRFIAQTLRTGSLTASSPGSDLEFFRE